MLQLENVHVRRGETTILRDIRLSVDRGEILWIRGPSGGGKSTLLKVLFCAEFFEGRLLFRGRPVTPADLPEYRSRLGFISQRLPAFDGSTGDVLRYPFRFRSQRHRPFPGEQARRLLAALRFDPEICRRPFADLSGGEKQRLMVLLLLLIDRPVFLLDEVTAALDPENIDTVIRLLTEGGGRTVVSVSHNTEWGAYATRRLIMEAGRLREDS